MTAGWPGRAGDDTGASLVLALALMTFVGLVIGALLSYSSASLRATDSADARATRTYEADGALKTAVNQLRNTTFNNDAGKTCPPVGIPRADGTTITVTCAAGPGTGGASERVPVRDLNRPAQTVLALGTNTGEPGIAQLSTGALRVHGKVISAGAITSATGSLESVDAAIVSKSTCSGTVVSRNATGTVVPTVCAATTTVPGDPGYAQPTAGLTYQPLPTCGSSRTVEFLPGYYDDAVGLTDMMDGVGSCAGKTFLFQAAAGGGVGVFYFDFHNGEGGGLPAGPRVWTISDAAAEVVGGTPQGWTPDVSTPSVPGACVSPLRAAANNGVEFVFGGDSRMSVQAGAVELCGQYSTTVPPVAIYGAKSGPDPPTSGPVTLKTDGTGTNPTSGPAFANPVRITNTDASAASVVINSTSTTGVVTASVVVKGFVPGVAIPAGSVLTAANLVLVHRDNNATSAAKLSLLKVSVASTRAGAPTLTGVPQPTIYQDGSSGTAYHTDTLNLLTSLAGDVHANGFTGLQVRLDASTAVGHRVTENVDSIQLSLSWRPPAVRAQSVATVNGIANCIPKYPSGCDLLETAVGAVLSVQGTIYAPLAVVDLRLSGVSYPVVRAGLIVRAMQAQLTPAAGYTDPLIELPNISEGAVDLEVYFRVVAATKVVATARVRYVAADPTVPSAPGQRSVTVLSWTIRRS